MRRLVHVLGLFLVAPSLATAQPVAKRIPKEHDLHGDRRVDDYHWLRNKGEKDVVDYLTAENAWTEASTRALAPLAEHLYKEIIGRIVETDQNVPYKLGPYWYYVRFEEGKQYAIHARKKGSMEAAEELLLDLNALAQGHTFMALGGTDVSDDATRLAYSTDQTGFREFDLQIKDLKTGRLFPERMAKVSSFAFAADGKTLFYVTDDAAKRAHKLWRHTLGQDPKKDVLVYEEKDELFSIEVSRTRSRAYVILDIHSQTTTEVRYLPASTPRAAWKVMLPRAKDIEYDADHNGKLFYIRINDTGRNFRLVTAPVANPARAGWKELIPHRPEIMISRVDLLARHMVVFLRRDALPRLQVIEIASGAGHEVELAESVYNVTAYANREFDTDQYRFTYTSLVTPPSVYEYDLSARTRKLLKQDPVKGGYDPARYQSERLWASASDGTRIPISLVYRKDRRGKGPRPLLLTGYGAYGYPYWIGFDSARLSLLDRGVVFAVGHIRGGGDLGKTWHDGGRMRTKRNTFTDFIAVAEHLIKTGWTARDRLAVSGGSAGGLLMGAVTNLRPDLFKVVLSYVPFVDVLNTMLDASLPLTVTEYEEWGNPNLKDDYAYMRTYSPYDNIVRKAYPAMLVRTSYNDSQVMYWEPAKYVAKLRAHKTDKNPLYLKTNMGAGHGGHSGRYDRWRDVAFDYAFLLTQLGVEKVVTAKRAP